MRKFLTCGILSHGFAQMHCDTSRKRNLVAFSCKGRGFCPSCVFLPSQQPEASATTPSMPTFQAASKPTQEETEFIVRRARERILRYLEKRGVLAFAAAPGDDEVNAVLGEGFGESDPAHSTSLHAASSGSSPAGPAQKRAPVRMLREADTPPEPKGYLCARIGVFNLHAGRRVAPNDKQGREVLCRYILRPPSENERLHQSADGSVTVDFKRPWSDGTRSIGLAPLALLSRLAARVPPPRRHVRVYSGVLASNSPWRRLVIPKTGAAGVATKSQLPLVKKEEAIQALLTAMRMPTQATGPPARAKPEPVETEALELEWSGEGESADWPEYPD